MASALNVDELAAETMTRLHKDKVYPVSREQIERDNLLESRGNSMKVCLLSSTSTWFTWPRGRVARYKENKA